MKKQNKKHKNAKSIGENGKLMAYTFFFFFHVISKILNFNMWTAKHLAQAPLLSWLYT
jgi:hypothetical protein